MPVAVGIEYGYTRREESMIDASETKSAKSDRDATMPREKRSWGKIKKEGRMTSKMLSTMYSTDAGVRQGS